MLTRYLVRQWSVRSLFDLARGWHRLIATGAKKGEKVDYAVKQSGSIQLLIECKRAGDSLGFKHASQLYRYFSVTEARIAILTNGVR